MSDRGIYRILIHSIIINKEQAQVKHFRAFSAIYNKFIAINRAYAKICAKIFALSLHSDIFFKTLTLRKAGSPLYILNKTRFKQGVSAATM